MKSKKRTPFIMGLLAFFTILFSVAATPYAIEAQTSARNGYQMPAPAGGTNGLYRSLKSVPALEEPPLEPVIERAPQSSETTRSYRRMDNNLPAPSVTDAVSRSMDALDRELGITTEDKKINENIKSTKPAPSKRNVLRTEKRVEKPVVKTKPSRVNVSTSVAASSAASFDAKDVKNTKNVKDTKTIAAVPHNLTPTPRGELRYYAPEFYRGIYLNNGIIFRKNQYTKLLDTAKSLGINTLVIDVQPRMPDAEFIKYARESDFYLVSRVVVFEGGLKTHAPNEKHLNAVLDYAEDSVKCGFMEVQLDYIRFADRLNVRLNLNQRYLVIEGILKMATDRLRPYRVRVGADLFGRISFNKNDEIGQKLEIFSAHLDTIYPMLYPSHFYGDPDRIRDPYGTIYDGTELTMKRMEPHTKVIPYIQGFPMNIAPSGLNLVNYIHKQIKAAENAGGAGYVIWNASNKYEPFFAALRIKN